jgi:hypothetical protein
MKEKIKNVLYKDKLALSVLTLSELIKQKRIHYKKYRTLLKEIEKEQRNIIALAEIRLGKLS